MHFDLSTPIVEFAGRRAVAECARDGIVVDFTSAGDGFVFVGAAERRNVAFVVAMAEAMAAGEYERRGA